MNWDAIGAVGQVLGSVGVLITLMYLSVQVGHARRETRRSASLVRVSSASQQQMAFAQNESLLCGRKQTSRLVHRYRHS